MRESLIHDLENIGLTDKEAKVYLAALELGQATAQSLAVKAMVNRPTTYIMIEALVKRGLISSIEKGAKRYFVAAGPEQLLDLMAGQRKEIQKKEEIVRRMLASLQELAYAEKDRTSVRTFEGGDVWTALQRDILASKAKEIMDLATPPACLRGDLADEVTKKCHVIAGARIPVAGDVVIYGTKVFLSSMTAGRVAVLIDDPAISATLLALCAVIKPAPESQPIRL